MNIENQSTRLEQILGISRKAELKFIEGDKFGTIFALIEAGVSEIEYKEFLAINPHNWYDSHTCAVLEQAILHKGINGSPMMLRSDSEWIVATNRQRIQEVIH